MLVQNAKAVMYTNEPQKNQNGGVMRAGTVLMKYIAVQNAVHHDKNQ